MGGITPFMDGFPKMVFCTLPKLNNSVTEQDQHQYWIQIPKQNEEELPTEKDPRGGFAEFNYMQVIKTCEMI